MWSIIHKQGFPACYTLSRPTGVLWPKNAKHAVHFLFFSSSKTFEQVPVMSFLAYSLWQLTNIVFSYLKVMSFESFASVQKAFTLAASISNHFSKMGHSFWVPNLESVAILSDMDRWCFPIKWPFSGHIVRDSWVKYSSLTLVLIPTEAWKIRNFIHQREFKGCNLLGAGTNNHSECPDGCHLEAVSHYWSQLVFLEWKLAGAWWLIQHL